MWNPYDFTGKKYIVAGATSGMGKACAIKLAEQGAVVFLVGRNREKLQNVMSELKGNNHRCYIKDFSVAGGCKELFDDCVADGSKPDGMVYAAGIAQIMPVRSLSKSTMDESMTVNFYSFIEMVSLMSKAKYHNNASIVGISSISTQYPQKGQGLYVATKAAMNAMTASLAIELAEKGIRINTVLPAATNTPMLEAAIANKTEEQIQTSIKQQVLGMIEPDDIADVTLFLLSEASNKITGREIYADGGYLNLIV